MTATTIKELGWYSVDAAEASEIAGFGLDSGGIAMPYPNVDWTRVRLDTPQRFTEKVILHQEGSKVRQVSKEREARYVSPQGSGNHAFVLPQVSAALNNPKIPIAITEGEKKAVKATQEGLATIAIPGVWSWRGRSQPQIAGDTVQETDLLAELAEIDWLGRLIYLLWDSDAFQNSDVLNAGRTLEAEFRRRGADVRLVAFPSKPGGQKVGLDDYLQEHTLQELLEYAHERKIAALQRNFDILSIEKLNTSPPAYTVALSWGYTVSGLLFDDLISWSKFRRAVGKTTNRLPTIRQEKGEDTWGQYLDDVMAINLFEEDVPEEAHPDVIWWERVATYLRDRALEEPEALAERRAPYRQNGMIYVHGPSLLQHLNRRYKDAIEPGKLWDIMRRREVKSVLVRLSLPEGSKVVRSWATAEANVTPVTPDEPENEPNGEEA